jgi:hypothetical protein
MIHYLCLFTRRNAWFRALLVSAVEKCFPLIRLLVCRPYFLFTGFDCECGWSTGTGTHNPQSALTDLI